MAQKKDKSGHLKLGSLKEVNQYCFFVAGVVGEALAKLVSHVEPQFQTAKFRILDAHHFGLFLQKVNILKDQVNDRGEGREFEACPSFLWTPRYCCGVNVPTYAA